jgi:serine/threonine protein kinase
MRARPRPFWRAHDGDQEPRYNTAPSTNMALSAGARLGSYEIGSALGAGGMGEVYRARDTKLGRDVAVKILPEMFSADPERVARFEREAQLLAALNHPHIAAIYGLEESGSTKFLVLELVDGESLDARLKARSPSYADGAQGFSRAIHVTEALALARQIVNALEAAHDKGIIHRDLKPANIMLTPDGRLLILVGRKAGGRSQLYLRHLDQLQAVALGGTEDARSPFFSPDGQWIGFFAGGKVKKVSVTGGAPIALCDAPNPRGGAWSEDNSIVFLPAPGAQVPIQPKRPGGSVPSLLAARRRFRRGAASCGRSEFSEPRGMAPVGEVSRVHTRQNRRRIRPDDSADGG